MPRCELMSVCGTDLRCPLHYYEDNSWHNVTKHILSSSLVSGHHSCVGGNKMNNSIFESIDRFDENEIKREKKISQDINITSFTTCITRDRYRNPGRMCGSKCRENSKWCYDTSQDECNTGKEVILTTDPRLCSNPQVWRNVSCNKFNRFHEVYYYGLRCRGSKMRCVYPWYTIQRGETDGVTRCEDKSDQVFNSSLTCRQHLQQNMDFHTEHFCHRPLDEWGEGDAIDLICTNKTQWLAENPTVQNQLTPNSDPHSCQSSCSVPGPDCVACTNTDYFLCAQSGLCLHPDLLCDGHPQCPGGEDEEIKMCHQSYIKKKIIEPFATYKCQSKNLYYENMFLYMRPHKMTELSVMTDQMSQKMQGDTITIFLYHPCCLF